MEKRKQLEAAIAALEAQRAVLGDSVVDASLAALRQQLAALPAAESAEVELRGERKLVTVMFADISGFTALAETMDPEAVRDLMNACFEKLVPIIERYEGTVDKFIGDEIMVLFGAPLAHEDDAERTLHAALEVMDALEAFNAERGTQLGMHVGINTGWTIAGGIGPAGHQQYSVMGDAVNVASRLEEISERGEILVGPDTHRLTAPLFEFAELAPVQVKGKAEAIPVFRLLAAKPLPDPVRGIAGLESPLVGRDGELEALREAIERLEDGRGGIVTLVGEAGLGKSRLVAEVFKNVLLDHLCWVEGRCLSYGTSIAYLLWLDVLRGLLEVTVEDSVAVVRDALRERVTALCPDVFGDVYPFLSRVMSLPSGEESEAVLGGLEGEQIKARTFDAVGHLIERAAAQRPLVVVCEDLHWADPTSIELLEHLLPLVERVPLLFICVLRPEHEHGSQRIRQAALQQVSAYHTGLLLEPLSPAESGVLVNNLLHVGDLPEALRARILSHTEGNPFYVEEVIRSLIDSGAITHDEAGGRWVATRDVTEIAIPDTLHGVLAARIDRLQEETKRVLQLASVVGRIFLFRVLAAIAEGQRELDQHLLTLQQEEMIRERAHFPELEYIFKHHLTQEAAYSGLLHRDRQMFHRRVAEALEQLFPDRLEEQVGLMAYHWEQAAEPQQAVKYLLLAGDQAQLAYAHGEAIDYYRRALAFLKKGNEHERAARTLMKLGLTYHTAFDFQQARQAYREGFALWQLAGEVKSQVKPPPAPHPFRTCWWNPTSLDPTVAADLYSAGVIHQLFAGLVELSPEMEVMPDIARTWEVSEGGRRYTFHLRDDVHWSDGVTVTAEDFEFAWKRLLNPRTGSRNANLLYDVKGARAFHLGETSNPDHVAVRALDRLTLTVELERPTSFFPLLLTQFLTFAVPRHAIEAHGEAWTELENLVTNGPFRLVRWQHGESISLARYAGYHGLFKGNVEQVELGLSADPVAMLARYEEDELDVLNLRVFSPLERDQARKRHAGEYVMAPSLGTMYIGFDLDRPPFADRRVRQAFVQAADREELAGVVMHGYVFPATGGLVPPGMVGHSEEISLPYDPERARQLLSEAGYPLGSSLPTIDLWTFRGFELPAQYLADQWAQVLGAKVVPETLEYGAFRERMAQRMPHAFMSGWTADYPDPDNFLSVGPTQYYIHWQHAVYDSLVEKARQVTDQRERMKLYRQADQILVEEAAITPLVYTRLHLLIKPWVKKLPTSATTHWFWKDVIIEAHDIR